MGLEYSFEYKDYIIDIEIYPGFACDDPCEWDLVSIKYVDGESCDFYQLSEAVRHDLTTKCESWASAKAYDSWLERAMAQADYLIDSYKEDQ